ncbi:MAG: Crp/Fnr family transcriptional regulator [Candidatus Sericytochromatia bacterium]|nr:Crp/Fnr family transcriptional regulator [Candidatus Sericytochromatia bacterium]
MSQFHLTHFSRGDTVFTEGSVGNVAYLIRSGAIVIHRTVDNEDILLALLSPGEVFGEMALVTAGTRTATATAAEDTELVALAESTFTEHLQRGSPLLVEVFSSMAKRLEFTSRQLRKPRTKYPTQSVGRILDLIRQVEALRQSQAVTLKSVVHQIQEVLDLNIDDISQIFDQMASVRLIEWRNSDREVTGTVYFIEPASFPSRLDKFLESLPEKAISSLSLKSYGDRSGLADGKTLLAAGAAENVFLDLLTVEREHGMSFRELRRYIASGELPPDMIHFPAKAMLQWIGHMRVAYGDVRTEAYPTGTLED